MAKNGAVRALAVAWTLQVTKGVDVLVLEARLALGAAVRAQDPLTKRRPCRVMWEAAL